ncbi:MAG: class I SAM-dependent methyltransferase [Actinomycetia bacterium]|nr:class I SAM-dependent methyltransferase [Actinomycetes bacterium]
MTTEYVFDTGSDPGHEQVVQLAALYDDETARQLDRAGDGRGLRCLDIGAGNGSVAAMLAQRAGPDGRVIAADIEPRYVSEAPGVTVVRHDINDGVPAGGPYELIHARLVLMHLLRRDEVLSSLAGALAPGGHLVIGDLGERLPIVTGAPSDDAAELVERVIRIGMTVLAPKVGMSFDWAEGLASHLSDAGLVDVSADRVSRACRGGTPGCLLFRSYALQLEDLLRGVGVTVAEIERFVELMSDPALSMTFYELIYASGRKPAGGAR